MKPASVWAPLAFREYRMLWVVGLIANVGMWMQNVSAAWLMTTLTASPVMVALIQTAASLPIFLFGLPGGVLADLIDRRRLLLGTQIWMCGSVVVLVLLSYGHWIGPWTLIGLTFSLGTGYALQAAAWQANASDVVPRASVAAAVTLNSVAFNVGRAVGPAVAGALIVGFGSGAVFVLDLLCFGLVAWKLARWRRTGSPVSANMVAPEHMFGGILSGLRYVYHSRHLRIEMLRTGVLVSSASGLWALLPLVARDQLGLGASGYGLLLGSLGLGAVLGALTLVRVRNRYGLDVVITGGSAVFAIATLATGYVKQIGLVYLALIAGGAAWIAIAS